MSSFLQEYLNIKCSCVEYLDHSPEKQTIINSILQIYSKIIQSPRTVESITSSISLIKILEKRNCLSYSNIEPLLLIVKQIDGSESLQDKIKEYKRNLELNDIPLQIDYYGSQTQKPLTSSNKCSNSNNENDVDNLICETVAESIGKYWQTMARYLGIKENHIDSLECEFRADIESIVKQIFMKIKAKQPKNWKYELCIALDKSRRSDLRQNIEKIMRDE